MAKTKRKAWQTHWIYTVGITIPGLIMILAKLDGQDFVYDTAALAWTLILVGFWYRQTNKNEVMREEFERLQSEFAAYRLKMEASDDEQFPEGNTMAEWVEAIESLDIPLDDAEAIDQSIRKGRS